MKLSSDISLLRFVTAGVACLFLLGAGAIPEEPLVVFDGADSKRSLTLHPVPDVFSVTWLPGIESHWPENKPRAAGPARIETDNLVLERVGSAGAPRFHTDRYRLVRQDMAGSESPTPKAIADRLANLPGVLLSSPLYSLGKGGTGPWRAPTPRVLLQLTGPEQEGALRERVAHLGGQNLQRRGVAPDQWGFDFPVEATVDPISAAMLLHRDPSTRWAQVNWIQERSERYIPDDPRFEEQWHLNNTGQSGGEEGNDVRSVEAFDLEMGDAKIIIAVMDSGIDTDHPDLIDSIVPGWDFINGDSNPSPGGSSHGTSVSGLAGAPANGIGVVGTCPGCSIMPLRMLGTSDETEAEALDFAATQGAAVINNSWGPTDGTGVETPIPSVMAAAIDNAVTFGRDGLGTVVFWAAGNGHPVDTCDLDGFVAYPSTIAVGASTDSGEKSSYSELCEQLDLTAPSGGGGASLTTTNIGGYTSHFGGTSASSPVATGVGALLLSAAPELPWDGVREVLRSTADKLDPGDADYDLLGHSLSYGYGRVDSFAALSAELSYLSVSPANPLCDSDLTLTVYGPDLVADSITATATSSLSEPEGEVFVLERKNELSFEGVLPLLDVEDNSTSPGDGLLGVNHEDVITLEVAALEQSTQLTLDCEPPAISGITIEEVHYWGALLSWETSEEATTTLEWGPTGSNSSEGYATEHSLWALDLTPCTEYRAGILATDRTGNQKHLEEAALWLTPGNPGELPEDALEGADPCDVSTWYPEPEPDEEGEGCQCGVETGGSDQLLWVFLVPALILRRARP